MKETVIVMIKGLVGILLFMNKEVSERFKQEIKREQALRELGQFYLIASK